MDLPGIITHKVPLERANRKQVRGRLGARLAIPGATRNWGQGRGTAYRPCHLNHDASMFVRLQQREL